jgi:hypothetical protein
MSLRIVTANTAWQMRGDADYIAHLCAGHDVVLLQEAKDTHVAKVAPEGWTALQDTTDQAHMGTAMLVRNEVARVDGWRLTLGAKPILRTGKRVRMLTRYILEAHVVELAGNDPHHPISAHFPPHRFSPLQIPFRYRLRKVIKRHPHSTTGTDANQPLIRVARRLRVKSMGEGIVGLLFGPGVKASGKVVSRWGIDHKVTDHPSIAAVVVSVRKA